MRLFELKSDKMPEVWANAGRRGGGGILDVPSNEELDAVMATFPLGPFSLVTVNPITELDKSLDLAVDAYRQMMG